MSFARTRSVTLVGVHGVLVEVEADLANGVPGFALVGLPDTALAESRDRVRAAMVNSGEDWPVRRVTVGLSPAGLPKHGSGFDLAVACALLAATGTLPAQALEKLVLLGELGLDGSVRPVRGVLPAVLAAARAGFQDVVVPRQTAAEAALVPGVRVLGVHSLRQLLAVLRGQPAPAADEPPPDTAEQDGASWARSGLSFDPPDLADVRGQPEARRAVEICAAGAHHLFLCGTPGAGKTMLAERLPGVLPRLDRDQALEVTAIHSVAGTLPPGRSLIDSPPYCGPHHTATAPAIVGGGSGTARPGAVSLSHRGILFLDEAPEFSVKVLDALRQPLECGEVVIARAHATTCFPARFVLVLAANPCPCGLAGAVGAHCACSPAATRRYLERLSGPLLDRIDVRVDVRPVSRADLLSGEATGESSAAVAERVSQARQRAAVRLIGTPWRTNAEVPGRELRSRWRPAPGALSCVERDMDRGRLTARGLDRVLRVAWTISDLAGHDRPTVDDVRTALYYRTGVDQTARL